MSTASLAKRLLISTTLLGIATVTAAACAGDVAPQQPAAPDPSTPAAASASAPAAENPIIVAAGEIACPTTHPAYNDGEGTATECRQKHTANLILDADA